MIYSLFLYWGVLSQLVLSANQLQGPTAVMNTQHPSRSRHALWKTERRERETLRRTVDLSAEEEEAAASAPQEEGKRRRRRRRVIIIRHLLITDRSGKLCVFTHLFPLSSDPHLLFPAFVSLCVYVCVCVPAVSGEISCFTQWSSSCSFSFWTVISLRLDGGWPV